MLRGLLALYPIFSHPSWPPPSGADTCLVMPLAAAPRGPPAGWLGDAGSTVKAALGLEISPEEEQ